MKRDRAVGFRSTRLGYRAAGPGVPSATPMFGPRSADPGYGGSPLFRRSWRAAKAEEALEAFGPGAGGRGPLWDGFTRPTAWARVPRMQGEQRRSARHLLGVTAEVHLGPHTVIGVVRDVSQHGMGLVLPTELNVKTGDVVWVLVEDLASYAITGTVRRSNEEGLVGIELDEVLAGQSLEKIEGLPLVDGEETE